MNIFKELFSNLLFVLVLAMGAALILGSRMLDSRGKALATANETINALQTANDQMATEFQTLQREERGLRTLLAHQNAALTELDQQQRKTADDLQRALATPLAGRPDCAREPLPVGALRLLQPAKSPGAHPGGETPPTARADAPLPGA
jgi:ABC-type transporter Mla subunit MlaD